MTAPLPAPAGPLSARVRDLLDTRTDVAARLVKFSSFPDDPLDLDAQLALFMLHELSYAGWDGLDISERSLAVVDATNQLNSWFETSLREAIAPPPSSDPAQVVRDLIDNPGPSIARYLAARGTAEQLAESILLRSPYHSKEADPHTRVIPRLTGHAKRTLIEIQAGEYGLGHQFSHAQLFARALRSLGYDATPAAYIDSCTGPALATSNFLSMAASQRRLRGAVLGQLSLFEMDSVTPNDLMVKACDRLHAPEDVRRFFHIHVMADVEHEELAAEGFLGTFAQEEPDQRYELIFGAQAQAFIDVRHSAAALRSWSMGRSALRTGVTSAPPAIHSDLISSLV